LPPRPLEPIDAEDVPPAVRTNAEWLSDLRTGGAERDAALVDLRSELVKGLSRGLVGWVETDGPDFGALAEDFADEAVMRILGHLDEFEGRSRFTTWGYKIAIRVALTELRRRRWKDVSLERLLEGVPGVQAPRQFSDPGVGPEMTAERVELLLRVERLIAQELTPKQATALVAVTIRGMPLEEVADRMGSNRNALYKLLHDARLRLQKALAREGLTPADVLSVFEGR
jgi:RNA polymerase sigma-70 factor (ECF subfamily)